MVLQCWVYFTKLVLKFFVSQSKILAKEPYSASDFWNLGHSQEEGLWFLPEKLLDIPHIFLLSL